MSESISHSSILNLSKMIEYQEDAVISKTVFNRKTGTITIFAFDEGQGLSEHTAPFDAIVQVLEGESEVKISGESYLLSSGQMIIMPANQPHSLYAVKRFKMMLIMIRDNAA